MTGAAEDDMRAAAPPKARRVRCGVRPRWHQLRHEARPAAPCDLGLLARIVDLVEDPADGARAGVRGFLKGQGQVERAGVERAVLLRDHPRQR
jgi:hypothetical protein